MPIPSTARQYIFPKLGSLDNLVLLPDAPVPKPKPTEVLLKAHAVSLQYRDLIVANGTYPSRLPDNLIPCSDVAGEIVAVGDAVKDWKVGDRVCPNFMLGKLFGDETTEAISATALGGAVDGTLVEYRAYPSQALVKIPDHLSYEEASTLPCAGLTAYNALLDGYEPLKGGDTVLVLGTGGVSIFALQFAIASGATVICTSSSDEKLKIASKLGAQHVINYNTTPDWDEEIKRLTSGRGVDHIIEVGGNGTLMKSINALRIGGAISIIGFVGGHNIAAPDIIGICIRKSLKIRGIQVGSVQQFNNMNKLIAANPAVTRPVVDKVFPFNEAKAAYQYLASQAHVGKVVIRVD
ncbi:unnamed protein product [Mycena citricolor]|uniref:Enoyl reductase (ER) domain-containing protein n=1 Tax=Mycena citricolor TaxID=2018698 RepID=A0AAD2GV28_9AGAR|nr:unnamed protein product [Mycena citricolor]